MDHDRGLGMGDHTEERQEGSPWTMAVVSSSMGAINSPLNKLPAELEFTKLRGGAERAGPPLDEAAPRAHL